MTHWSLLSLIAWHAIHLGSHEMRFRTNRCWKYDQERNYHGTEWSAEAMKTQVRILIPLTLFAISCSSNDSQSNAVALKPAVPSRRHQIGSTRAGGTKPVVIWPVVLKSVVLKPVVLKPVALKPVVPSRWCSSWWPAEGLKPVAPGRRCSSRRHQIGGIQAGSSLVVPAGGTRPRVPSGWCSSRWRSSRCSSRWRLLVALKPVALKRVALKPVVLKRVALKPVALKRVAPGPVVLKPVAQNLCMWKHSCVRATSIARKSLVGPPRPNMPPPGPSYPCIDTPASCAANPTCACLANEGVYPDNAVAAMMCSDEENGVFAHSLLRDSNASPLNAQTTRVL